DTGGYGHIRHAGVDAHGVLVEDVDTLDSFYSAPKIGVANGGVFHAQEVELHGFRVDLAAVVEQHALAQPEHPGGEFLVRLPALGNTRDNVALVIDIGQAVVHGRGDTVGMLLIMTVRVKATRVVTHAKVQHTAALRMPLRCRSMGREA